MDLALQINKRLTKSQQAAVEQRLAWADQIDLARRLWAKDYTIWADKPDEIINRLGWLSIVDEMLAELDELTSFAQTAVDDGFTHCALLGMGGSSLAPEVMRRAFGVREGFIDLQVLDSTHPDAVAGLAERLPLDKTIFLVSSKSGGTLETLSLYGYFRHLLNQPSHFAVITDPSSSLADLAERERLRKTFLNRPDIGGRYSALSYFGLVPAALMGIDLKQLLEQAWKAEAACKSATNGVSNPGLALGVTIGELASQGRDKLTFVSSSPLESFGLWVEQLVAESSGKQGRGIVPVVDEPLGQPHDYTTDRVFVYIRNEQSPDTLIDQKLDALAKAGHPVITLPIGDAYALGTLFFIWEFAIAVACSLIEVNAFDQPNVEEAKDMTNKVLADFLNCGHFPAAEPNVSTESLSIYGSGSTVGEAVTSFLDQLDVGQYLAILAYLEPDPKVDQVLAQVRSRLRSSFKVATTFAYGPRFQHSTGQLHKGGRPIGNFLQIRSGGQAGVEIPGAGYDFAALIKAQATGDLQALSCRDLPILRVDLKGNVLGALKQLVDVLDNSVVGR